MISLVTEDVGTIVYGKPKKLLAADNVAFFKTFRGTAKNCASRLSTTTSLGYNKLISLYKIPIVLREPFLEVHPLVWP
ncbi:hypothetical protein HKD37_18G049702 [Glycine soja]